VLLTSLAQQGSQACREVVARISLTYRAMPVLASMRTPVRGVDEEALEAAAKEWAKAGAGAAGKAKARAKAKAGEGKEEGEGGGRMGGTGRQTSLAVTRAIRTG